MTLCVYSALQSAVTLQCQKVPTSSSVWAAVAALAWYALVYDRVLREVDLQHCCTWHTENRSAEELWMGEESERW